MSFIDVNITYNRSKVSENYDLQPVNRYKKPSKELLEAVKAMRGKVDDGNREQWEITIKAECLFYDSTTSIKDFFIRRIATDLEQQAELQIYFDSLE